jgi:hypothetical protein
MRAGWGADQVTPLFPFLWSFLSIFICFSIRLRSAHTILSSTYLTYPPHVSSSIMLLVTSASVLISYLYIATIHYVYIPLWSWVNPQLVINLVSGHPLLSDLSFTLTRVRVYVERSVDPLHVQTPGPFKTLDPYP